jgi:hypothetical protein
MVPQLQRIGFWNAWAAGWSCFTASLAVLDGFIP